MQSYDWLGRPRAARLRRIGRRSMVDPRPPAFPPSLDHSGSGRRGARCLRWQLLLWQVLAVISAAAANVNLWRPGMSQRWARVIGRVALLVTVIAGSVGILFVRVPALPQPAGSHQVSSQVFRRTDSQRPETFSLDPTERR